MALAIGTLLMIAAGSAVADPIIGAGSSASANDVAGTELINTANTGYISSSTSANAALLGNGLGYGFSRTSGAYAVSSTAEGIATGSAAASFRNTVSNTSGAAQRYSMSFHVYGGSISTFLNGNATLVGPENLLATFMASIKVNGTTVFSSGATVARTAGGTSGTKTGTFDLNPLDTAGDGDFFWGGGWYDVDLGIVDSGASIEVLAELTDSSASNVGTYTFDSGCCDSFYGCETGNEITRAGPTADLVSGVCTTTGFKGAARAFYGDPISFAFSTEAGPPLGGTQFALTATSVVPEPSAYGLVALALGAAGLVSRRRRSV